MKRNVNYQHEELDMKTLVALALLLLTAPAVADIGGTPFAEIGPAYAFTPGPDVQKENPLLMYRVGVEWEHARIEWGHQSSIRRGDPVDRDTDDRKTQWHFGVFLRHTFK